jgi:hypothetical protein
MPVWISAGSTSPVPELNDFSKLLPIVVQVIEFNLSNFISGFLTSREEPSQASLGGTSPKVKTG